MLNNHDLAPLPSDGVTPHWQNTAQWARNARRKAGLLHVFQSTGGGDTNEGQGDARCTDEER